MPRSPRGFIIAFVIALLVICILIFSMTMNNATSVSALEANGVGVYWDSNCNNGVSSIDWGTLEPGSVKNIAVYIRNEVDESQFLSMSTTNWNPSEASDYITLRWDYTGPRIDPGEVLQITLTLSVSRYIEGISSFRFDILVTGSDRLLSDVDGNGVIDIMDTFMLKIAINLEKTVEECPFCDVNGDGNINIGDIFMLKIIMNSA